MRTAILAAIVAVTGFSSAALAEGKKIGVSWAQFQEERWKIDEAAMKAAIEAAGNEYISAFHLCQFQRFPVRPHIDDEVNLVFLCGIASSQAHQL